MCRSHRGDAHPAHARRTRSITRLTGWQAACDHVGIDDRFINRELSWLAFDDRVLQLARRAGDPTAGAGQVLRHHDDQPRRVLPGPRRRAQGPGRGGRRGADRRRAHGHPAVERDQHPRPRAGRPPGARVPRRAGPGARRGRRGHRRLGRPRRRGPQADDRALRAAHLPRPDPARRRPEPPLPVHLRARPLGGRDGRRPRPRHRRPPLRPGQGADRLPPPLRGRRVALHPRRGADHRPPADAVRRHGHRRGRHVPGHPQRRPDDRGGGGRRPARGAGDGAAPPPVQQGRAPRGLRGHERRDARPADDRAGDRRPTTSTAAGRRSTSACCGSCTASTAPTSRTAPGRR